MRTEEIEEKEGSKERAQEDMIKAETQKENMFMYKEQETKKKREITGCPTTTPPCTQQAAPVPI